MASTVTVFETAARRAVIRVSPGKYLHEVRAEACEKFRLDPDKYGLKHSNKTIDVSTQFRLSGLPSGAKLELVQLSRSAGVVSIALQLPQSEAAGIPNGRLMDKFPSTTTLWQILRKFEDGVAGASGSKNLTARGLPKTTSGGSGAGRLYYEQPILTVVNREYGSFVDLQKTLSGLGLNSGNILVKLSYRLSDQPLEEAQEQIGRYFQDIEGSQRELEDSKMVEGEPEKPDTRSAPHVSANLDPAIMAPQDSVPVVASDASLSGAVSAQPPVAIDGISDRPITVYSAPTNSTPRAAAAAHNPSDYEFTVDHAKVQAAMYQAAGRNKPLPSDAEIEAQREAAAAKIAAIQSVQIKVRFPDQTSVVSDFKQKDTGRILYDWVKGLMQHGDAAFILKWVGPKGMADVPSDNKLLIKDVGMTGRVQVTLSWREGATAAARKAPVLKDQVSQVAQEIEVKTIPESASSGPSQSTEEPSDTGEKEKKKKAMPAWLKKSLPGKK